ncbi:MAG: iron ABC transporter permease, partial [Propionibacterium sp.]|nr:iron ABC transporter permease [Propionibacterium sp.]
MLATPALSMVFGAASVAPADVWAVVRSHLPGATQPVDGITNAIIWQNRLPRVLTGIGVGAILGVSGVALQAIVRNPLAEPYVLGISAGAATGAAFAMVVVGVTSGIAVAGYAFAAAALATGVVLMAGGRGHHSALQLILAGLAVGFIFQALTNLLIFSSDSPETSRAVVFWTLGSLSRATWPQVGGVLTTAVIL